MDQIKTKSVKYDDASLYWLAVSQDGEYVRIDTVFLSATKTKNFSSLPDFHWL